MSATRFIDPRRVLVTARNRSRIYRDIKAKGVRGLSRSCAIIGGNGNSGYHDLMIDILDDLLSDGWITAHAAYTGDGTPWGTVYVATNEGKGERP